MKSDSRPAGVSRRTPVRPEVPAVFEQDREKILRANAIFSSAGLEAPFTTEALRCLPPITIYRALTSLREAGVTDEAAGSAQRVMAAQSTIRQIHEMLDSELRRSRDLER